MDENLQLYGNFQLSMGPDRQNKIGVKLYIFSYLSVLAYVLGAQKHSLNETVLLSTNNICFMFKK